MTPQCNGIAERTNRTIIKTTRTMLADANLNLKFWGEAANTGVYIRNRVKSRVHGKTPYEIWYNKIPNIQHMRKFRCVAYILNKGRVKRKFESKTVKGIFMGYNDNKTYRVYIPGTGSIKCDCDVKFDEDKSGWDLSRHEETKNDNDDENDNLITVGLNIENEEDESEEIEVFDREENNVNLREEEIVSEGERSDCEQAREKILSNDNNGDEMEDNNQEMNTPSEEPNTSRKRGRKKEITREEIQARELFTNTGARKIG
ncbi:Copia protein [Melipona quadrifasciata]|uniref:Copia protein n=1 Tax=Melipona quadrifasciata TaxID=166423 RepID=A0A0N0U7B3_9HYME|nr:Copia protein [Melipona quadrifasciata]